jgi:hypothetical protein
VIDREALGKATQALFDEYCPGVRFAGQDVPHYQSGAQAAITAYLDSMKAKGWVMVPEQPTDKMAIEGAQYLSITPGGAKPRTAIDVWDAMISAAPEHGETK